MKRQRENKTKKKQNFKPRWSLAKHQPQQIKKEISGTHTNILKLICVVNFFKKSEQ